jgi:hypothetical protein
MAIIKIKGGLGNQLFQYAFGRYFSICNNVEVKIDNGINTNKQDTYRAYTLDRFNITIFLASKEEILKAKYPIYMISKVLIGIRTKVFHKYNIGYVPNILKTKQKYLDGFWQSYKYPNQIRDILLKEITLKEPLENKYQQILEQIKNTNSVSIHLRRGDYINDPKTKSAHLAFGLEYYEQAIKIVTGKIPDPTFFIFSDDIDWVRNNLKTNLPTVFVSRPEIKDFEELIIMSKCKNNIIANSTFSWWGAWLNQNPNKVVIAPKRWNNKFQKEYNNLLPPEWIPV